MTSPARGSQGTAPSPDEVAAIVEDHRWFPHRYHASRDELEFVWLPREGHRAISFLNDNDLARAGPRRLVPRRLVAARQVAEAPFHLVLHSGLAGSTLLARALDQEGAVMTLKEPQILSDLVAHCFAGRSPAAPGELLETVLALLARPFGPGESVIVKVNSVGNLLGPEILARRPGSRALCLHAPLPLFLASLARKGVWGRLWGRRMFLGLRSARALEFGFSDRDLLEQADLQLAAGAWLGVHRILASVGMQFGSARVRVTDSEKLTAAPGPTLAAIASHFAIALGVEPIVAGPVFQRHAKSGERFDSARRAEELRTAQEAHREEIEMVSTWARKVAEAAGIPWDLPPNLRL